MKIRTMFADDINRKINGVIKVDQSEDEVIEQELNEYVITKELKKHFITFFNYYSDAFDEPTADTGVWISGFFGSGKSHFLKMLSYLLENKTVKGISSVERFRKKFEDDPATYMLVDRAAKAETETILFNIDIESASKKDRTAVLDVFAKMFYKHLGFYGEDLKIVMLEKHLRNEGKTEEFRRAFEAKKGKTWEECRKTFLFHKKDVISALTEVLDMTEEDAKAFVNDKSETEISIAGLVEDIKEYLSTKPKDFRLLFMIDEVGQYVGTNTSMLLNLQSLVEKIGSECRGQVWVVCTGQEAVDEIIKVRSDEFSRIQARFKTRLSLSSSSVDEVIQKRILKKKKEAAEGLEQVYDKNDSVLRNLFSFTDALLDIKGYAGPQEFSVNFPFIPYQFIIMQKVFAEIRKHGNSGKHLSGGERSMLSGFQEAAQRVQEKDEYALVPFYYFYDTVHSFLESSIRRVIERCQRAAENGDGIEQQDVDVLKLLYLIRYIDDIPANLDNIVILMAEDIRMDKITMRETVRDSLDRLLSQNYIGRTGEVYNFLTDEEQDIQREIKNTSIDTANIVERISQIIFGDIFTTKKFRYGNYDFAFDQMTDHYVSGTHTGGMRLRFLTVATDSTEKTDLRLMAESKGNEAIVVLEETPYFESLESAMKIRKYVKQRNVSQLPQSVQDIIRNHQHEAGEYEKAAKAELVKAIEGAQFYVDGEHIENKVGNAKTKIEQALGYLVSHVYSELSLIEKNTENEGEIVKILTGAENVIPGTEPNRSAAAKVEEYLEMQSMKKLPTSMADIQSRYSAIPYGWKEIDIAAVVARLIFEQKVTVKYAGATIQPNDPKLPDMLRKKSEVGKTSVSKRQMITAAKMKNARMILSDLLDLTNIPKDEDGLVEFIVEKFTERIAHYEELKQNYSRYHYPDRAAVMNSDKELKAVLLQKKDNIALVDAVLKNEDALLDRKEDLQGVEGFFKNQVRVYDAAVKLEKDLHTDLSYLKAERDAEEALNRIRLIVSEQADARMVYRSVPELNGLMDRVKAGHNRLLEQKRAELSNIIRQCMQEIHSSAADYTACKSIVEKADRFYTQKKEIIAETYNLGLLDGISQQLWSYKDDTSQRLDEAKKPPKLPDEEKKKPEKPVHAKNIRPVYRQAAFPVKTMETEADIDAYLESAKKYLIGMLKNVDGIVMK